MSPDVIGLSLLVLGVLLLVAKLIRIRSRIAQKLFLPSSIIGGFLALVIGPEVVGAVAEAIGGEDAPLTGGLWPEEFLDVWASLPGLLISVVFATLFLGERIPKVKEAAELAGPQLALGVTMASGQYVIGLLLAVLLLVPFLGQDPMVGALIEVGFEGGHGTAAGLGTTFADLGFPEGQDLALGLATVGVVSGVVVGIALINWGVRTGRAQVLEDDAKTSLAEQRGLYEREEQPPAALMTVRTASVEPLAIHFAIVAVAILLGLGLLEALQALEAALWADTVELFEFVPLFPLAMIGGVVVQKVVDRFDRTGIVDRRMMLRIQGIALDLLIVSALATLSIQAIADNWVTFLLLAVAGLAWNVGAFVFLARRMIPRFWFERGIGDLGQSLGVTATGLILIRVADPNAATPAMEAFGYKQLAFEPFFGGGLVTAAALPLIAQFGPVPLLVVMAVVLALSLGTGILWFGRRAPAEEAARAPDG
ncbi:sodium/glutamate symporter [Blastococcus sp. KM273129]|uniref:sodium/glutamate symporter n=1 Tax=Blastococcus sp. KM273129 TaxID=2570315 RepID=UPI001F4037E5|nr:sodium/glutamate symporter [Blastococcus sp. KM273129]MCF6737468.1 sodium:glutamate symporter [Blastococcus sp. KM273129]